MDAILYTLGFLFIGIGFYEAWLHGRNIPSERQLRYRFERDDVRHWMLVFLTLVVCFQAWSFVIAAAIIASYFVHVSLSYHLNKDHRALELAFAHCVDKVEAAQDSRDVDSALAEFSEATDTICRHRWFRYAVERLQRKHIRANGPCAEMAWLAVAEPKQTQRQKLWMKRDKAISQVAAHARGEMRRY